MVSDAYALEGLINMSRWGAGTGRRNRKLPNWYKRRMEAGYPAKQVKRMESTNVGQVIIRRKSGDQ